MANVLAGDVGGTNTRLGVFEQRGPRPALVATRTYGTRSFETIEAMATAFLRDVGVQPSFRLTMSAADAAPYIGRYEYTQRTAPDSGKISTLVVTYVDSTLKGQWEPNDPYFRTFALIRIAPDWFAPGVYDDHGQIYEVYKPEMTFEFTLVNRKAVSLEVRKEDDELEAVGKRKP